MVVRIVEMKHVKPLALASFSFHPPHLLFPLLLLQSCLTLCNPMDCNPPGSSVHEDSPGKNAGVGSHFLLQGIFPTQGSSTHLIITSPALAGRFFTASITWEA